MPIIRHGFLSFVRRHLPSAISLTVVACFGSVWAIYVLGGTALDRHNLTWLWGDLSQVHVAWGQFLSDPNAGWLSTDRLSYPLRMSISLFDPMPILLLLTRPFAGFVDPGQQFFGWYFFVCLVLQGVFGYLATLEGLKRVRGDSLALRQYLAVMGGVFFASVPFTFSRFVGHTALSSQWVLALAVWATLSTLETGLRRWLLVNGLVLLLATGLNPYLALLVLISTSILTLVWGYRAGKAWNVLLLQAMFLVAVVAVGLYIFGFASASGAATGGYGVYSMNMLGPLDSNGHGGLFAFDVVDPTGGQTFEGYDYLGFGLLALCGFVFLSFTNHVAPRSAFPFIGIFLVIALCYGVALSTKVTFSGHSVDIPVPRGIRFLLGRFRASGRLFWMSGFWIIVVTMAAMVLRFGQAKAAALATVFVVLQIIDIRPIAQDVRNTLASGQAIDLDVGVKRPLSGIFVFPAWQCDHEGTPEGVRNYEPVGRFALAHRIPTNNFYAARTPDDQLAFHCDLDARLAKIDGGAVYLLSSNVYERYGARFSSAFNCKLRSGRQQPDHYWLCLPRVRE